MDFLHVVLATMIGSLIGVALALSIRACVMKIKSWAEERVQKINRGKE